MNPTNDRHVVHVIPSLAVGGAEVDLVAKCPVLRDVHGYRQTFVCLRRRGELAHALEERGCEVLGPLVRGRHDIGGLVALRRLLTRLSPALLHSHLSPATISVDAVRRVTPILRRVPWIASEHAAPARWGALSRGLSRAAIPRADRFALPSRALLELHRLARVDVGRATVLPNAVDVDRLAAVPGDARARVRCELGIAEDARVVGTVCRLVAVKNLPVLVRAVEALEVELVIAGDGPERARLRTLMSRLGLGARAHLLGTWRDVPSLLPALDVFVLPSSVETFGLALAEALVAGCPVVATRVGAIPEVVGPEIAGDLVPPGDVAALREAIVEVLAHPEAARARAERGGRSIRERFAVPIVAAAQAALYEESLAALPRPAA